MKKIILALLTVATLVSLTSCVTTITKDAPGGTSAMPDLDWEVVGEVTGTGEEKSLLGYLPMKGKLEYANIASGGGMGMMPIALPLPGSVAKSRAIYDALQKSGADSIMNMVTETKVKQGLFYTTTVTVKGIGIKISQKKK